MYKLIRNILSRLNALKSQKHAGNDEYQDTNTYAFSGKYKTDIFMLHGASVTQSVLEGKHEFGKNTSIYKCKIGLGTYVAHNSSLRHTTIGRFCAIGEGVRTFLGKHPTSDFVSIHPIFYSKQILVGSTFAEKQFFEEHTYVSDDIVVEIGNDVWIGNNVAIMDGIKIGHGAVVAAGSMVTKDVPPYAIVGGLPAKVIKYRFSEEEIEQLLKIKWWNKDFEDLRDNYKDYHSIKNFINKYGK